MLNKFFYNDFTGILEKKVLVKIPSSLKPSVDKYKHLFFLFFYTSALIVFTLINQPILLGASLCLSIILSGKKRHKLLKKTFSAIILFNLSVSLGYLILLLMQGNFRPEYLFLINLRVALLVFLGFWTVSCINLLSALSMFPLLCFVMTLAIGQIKTFERIVRDFRLAFQSRNPVKPSMLDHVYHIKAQIHTFLDKSLVSANDSALAMRSRGAFEGELQ